MKDLTDFLDKYNEEYQIVGDKVVGGNINLLYKNLTYLPESFGNLICNDLYLYCNNLTYLPESFGNLICNDLYLYCNNLTYLPESFGNLKCNDLYLYRNNLTYLPESFSNLKCNDLSLTNNNLTYLPILNENITYLSIDNFDVLTNLLYLQNLIYLCINKIGFYVNDSLTELLNNIRHQKVMNDMNKILTII